MTEPSISELFAEARPIFQDLTTVLLPDITWDTVLREKVTCLAHQGFRAIMIKQVTAAGLGCPVNDVALIATAREWMKTRGLPIILDYRHADCLHLVAGDDIVAFKMAANPAAMRIKASTRCFTR